MSTSDVTAVQNHFDDIEILPTSLIPTGAHVNKYAGYFFDTENNVYEWEGFKRAMDARPDAQLTLLKATSDVITRGNEVEWKASFGDKLVNFLRKYLDVNLSQSNIDSLKEKVNNTFSDLRLVGRDGGWFSYTKGASRSSCEYRIVFAYPFINRDESYFYSAVMTIKLHAEVREHSSWWGLSKTVEDSHSIEIRGMKLLVEKGFTAPSFESTAPYRRAATVNHSVHQ
ncbi:hypothetical protein VNI00_013105 [Paramarasmius palmivorus]|uniref:Uncharacterized protein n=1 Tax=Paramarasmius palmivorus TaxID=297713 RepID=A0AAW0BDZ0_9AGAR